MLGKPSFSNLARPIDERNPSTYGGRRLQLDLLSGASRAEQNANVHRQMLDFGTPRLGLWGRDLRFSLELCGLTLIAKNQLIFE